MTTTLTHSIDPAHALVTFTGLGAPTRSDIARAVTTVLSDPALGARRRFMIDARRAGFTPSVDFVKWFVGLLCRRPELAGSRWALLVDSEMPAAYGMGRMTEALLEGKAIEFRAFAHATAPQTMAEALAWLLDGVTPVHDAG